MANPNPLQHPLHAIASTLRPPQETPPPSPASPFSTAARIAGVVPGQQQDTAAYSTNSEGCPYPDPAHSKNVGGIPLVSDTFLLQKQQTFNRSKVLERMVHPSGSGAFGYFECTNDMSHLTKASLYSTAGKKTPIFMRFSTVTYGREFPDSGRNPRGFAIKHYTEEGNYDIVGLNWPIFFCRDPLQGPDVIRSQQRNPSNFLLDYNSLFDFLGNVPESNHAGMMHFSDHGTPKGWRYQHGYGCHTFKWVNKHGKFVYIKYHFLADHGQKQFTWPEAIRMSGEDPDYAKRDLYQAIERGEKITWTAKVQVMTAEQADPGVLGFDPFDVTKVWPRGKFPMQDFGRLVLNKNPENYHRDVEQSAFSPGSMVPGIEESPDMLLQFRMFFYRDAQYHRIGVNLHQVPVNCPFMSKSVSSLNFDGALRCDANTNGNPPYTPNSFVSKFLPTAAEAAYAVSDNIVSRQSHHYSEGTDREYEQARVLYTHVMDDTARAHLHSNTAAVLKLVDYAMVQVRYLAQCYKIAPEYARGIYDLLPSEKEFEFAEVESEARGAEKRGKERKFMPFAENHKLVGNVPDVPVYQQ